MRSLQRSEIFGGNFSFRKEAFELCGYFNTNYGFPKGTYEGSLGEDSEFSMRAKIMTKNVSFTIQMLEFIIRFIVID
jgi:hypothetical protein